MKLSSEPQALNTLTFGACDIRMLQLVFAGLATTRTFASTLPAFCSARPCQYSGLPLPRTIKATEKTAFAWSECYHEYWKRDDPGNMHDIPLLSAE